MPSFVLNSCRRSINKLVGLCKRRGYFFCVASGQLLREINNQGFARHHRTTWAPCIQTTARVRHRLAPIVRIHLMQLKIMWKYCGISAVPHVLVTAVQIYCGARDVTVVPLYGSWFATTVRNTIANGRGNAEVMHSEVAHSRAAGTLTGTTGFAPGIEQKHTAPECFRRFARLLTRKNA